VADLLFELGSEELPARFVVPALDDLVKGFTARALEAGLVHGAVRRFGTPRRLAILVAGVAARTADVTREVKGPGVKAAFDEAGAPREPAKKFAASVGRTVEQLTRVQTPKGEYLVAQLHEAGKPALELLPGLLTACLKGLSFPKAMRWGDVEQSYGRPLQWVAALLDGDVVPLHFADVTSGRATRGHRFLAPAPIALARAGDYEAALEQASVIADLEKRRALLEARLKDAAAAAGATVLPDEALLDQVLNLVELPNPVVGTFEARHLDLPPEVLIQEMRSHQRYFSLVDGAGKLVPKFIAVSNTPVNDVALSVQGYERVLRARLTDGRFFFDEDRRTPLGDRVARLGRRMWVAPLGSMAEKTERLRALGAWFARATGHAAALATVDRAALLCKADLETGMVGEFPELQGVMGREYALAAGEPREVALAVFEHYLPRNAADGFPTGDAGALVGLADRLDSIVGLFAIGKKPTGAKDEGGLRRACLAIINLSLQRGYRFSLGAAVDEALRLLDSKLAPLKRKPTDAPVRDQVLDFFRGRLESLWREDHRPDLVEAVLAAGFDDLAGAARRLAALSTLVAEPGFAALAQTFKRVANIVEKQAREVTRGPVEVGLLQDPAEQALQREVARVAEAIQAPLRAEDYPAALGLVAELKAPVDTFFDQVMVMAPEPALKTNRIRLLLAIGGLFGQVADFSRIQAE
jgi:glycyl-tRNA synthetase beta chain